MDINEIRKKIDLLDKDILDFLNKRAALAKDIGRLKDKSGSDFYVPNREKKIILELARKNKGPLPTSAVSSVYREIFNVCRSLESRLKIAYFGPEGTFTHQAALKNFGGTARYVSSKTITDVFTEVEKDRVNYGVVPIENSTEGIVNHTLDMFIESDLVISSEISMQIEECLLSISGRKKDVKKVYSFPTAIGQCRNWLEKNLPGVPVIEVSSTSEAARRAVKEKDVAAIASEAAAGLYGLEIIEKGIEDTKENYTRFLVIGKKEAGASGRDKTSILFSVKDKVGVLHDMLAPFKKYKISLTKIESRPTKKRAWQYIFFIDFLGHVSEPRIKKALHELSSHCLFMKMLGSYPRAE